MTEARIILTFLFIIGAVISFISKYTKSNKKQDTTNTTKNTNTTSNKNYSDTKETIADNQGKNSTSSRTKMTEDISHSKLDYLVNFLVGKQLANKDIFLKRKPFTIPLEMEINIRTTKDNPQIYDKHLRELLNFMLLYVGLPYSRC